MRYSINEFFVESAIFLPHNYQEATSPPAPDAARVAIGRASPDHLSLTLRRIRCQLVYDVRDGFLIEPQVGPEFATLKRGPIAIFRRSRR